MESKQEKIAEVESEGKGRHSEEESGRHSEQTHELSAIVSRARQSRWPAVPMEEAYKSIEAVLKEIDPCFKYEPVVALQPGQVLAEKITAPADVPTCCKSIKDGYAVLFADGAGDREVVGSSTAGAPFTGSMTNGQCVRVSTGAVVPACADAVVQVEDTEIVKHDNKEELVIKIKKAPSRIGQDIRKPGDDMRKGDLLFDVGCTLSAGEIGVINEIGLKVVAVYRRPKVCVMSTGNELVESMTEEIPPGCIRDSNRPQLLALFKSLGFKPIDAGIAPDRRSDLVVAIKNAFGYASVLVTSGGVSMGEHDLLKDILENDLGFKIHFGRVWMKPGMPATFATGVIGGELRCVFALPGNPVSSWACAHLFAAPLLRHLAGHLKIYNSRIYVKLADGVKLGERPEYKRAWLQMPDRMTDEMQDEFWKPRQETGQVQKEKQLELLPIAHITGGQLSSRLASTIGANVLLELPQKSDGLTQLERGEVVQAFVIASI